MVSWAGSWSPAIATRDPPTASIWSLSLNLSGSTRRTGPASRFRSGAILINVHPMLVSAAFESGGIEVVFVDYHEPHWAHPLKGVTSIVSTPWNRSPRASGITRLPTSRPIRAASVGAKRPISAAFSKKWWRNGGVNDVLARRPHGSGRPSLIRLELI